ncbi:MULTISPECIES: aminopeptidase [unclassified Pseudodesulfovibrio]|uniref:aminopeptidase n=1 Tax=unclassified Pseudodesulfovibrio TaxID=2661612 RepID=UPI000FEB5FE8|nr:MULTISPECIES: aminopeptidase [unclassified Pseudodesulfovibrio]MCJ2166222.1 aminopeptidase [Pseudodesulfovibrio sp. S3-i]RWU02310.1 aminopeptidase [Pseudodesulfovibrio sp. S3]
MFTKEELKKYAETLWWGLTTARTKSYAPGDFVLLRFDADALPLAETMFDMLIEKGINPIPRQNMTANMELSFYGKGTEAQLTDIPAGDKEFAESLNGLISLIAPASLTHLQDVDSKRIGQAAVARKFMREIMEVREQTGDFGWTLCIYPTKALAEAAKLTMDEFKAQVVKACYLDDDNPPARWAEIFNEAEKVKAWLNSLAIEHLNIKSEHTDLTVVPGKDRRWLGVSGHNIPSFEIFLSPDWRGTEGIYYADQPSFRSGNFVEGVRLTFERGIAVKTEAKTGAEFVAKQLTLDEGANRLGEFSLTDRRFSKINAFMANTLFDENFGGPQGNCHVAVGASYADTYAGDQSSLDAAKKKELGFNDSALHWDLVNTEQKTVTATLKGGTEMVIYKDGEFLYE